VAEIRERDEKGTVSLGVGWQELLAPELLRALAKQVDGLRIGGLDEPPLKLDRASGLAGDLVLAAYMGLLFQWHFEKPAEVEIGWGMKEKAEDPEAIEAACKLFAGQGVFGASWVTLVDPSHDIRNEPPWSLHPGLERAGLLDSNLELKEYAASALHMLIKGQPKENHDEFIDVRPEEYMAGPDMHLHRLWNRFRESFSLE
jgi:hypothetical protein